MDIKERIEKIKPYFQGMQVANIQDQSIIYVIVKFPPKWIIDEEIPNKYGVSISQGNNPGEFYFCVEMEKGFDMVFEAIESNINKMLTAQERAQLLRQKVSELQELFMDESISIETLRTLEFSYKQKRKTVKKDIVKETIEEVNNELNVSENGE